MDRPRPRVRTHAGTAPGRERELLERWLIHGDQLARETLSLMFLPVARRIARRYENTGEAVEDLVQVASIGLLKAIDRFDLRRTTSLRAYAERMIDGELRHHLRDASPSLYVPRALYGKVRADVARARPRHRRPSVGGDRAACGRRPDMALAGLAGAGMPQAPLRRGPHIRRDG